MGISPVHNFLGTMVSQSLHKAVRFLIMAFTIKAVGADTWGQITIAMTVISYLLLVSDFGDGIVASVLEIKNDSVEDELLRSSAWKHIAWGGVSSFVFFALFSINHNPLYGLLAFYSLIVSLKGFAPEWLFLRHELNSKLNLFLLIRSLFQLGLLFAFRHSLDARIFILLEIIAEIFWLFLAYLIWPLTRKRRFFPIPFSQIRKFLVLGSPLFLMNFAVIIHSSADVFILNLFSSHSVVGSYAAVYKFIGFFYLIGSTLSIIFRARMATLIQGGLSDEIPMIVSIVFRLLFLASLLNLIASFTFLPALLSKLLSLPQILDFYVVQLLSLYILFAFGSSIFVEFYVASLRRKELLMIALCGALVNVSINFALIPKFGANGAAVATVLAELSMLVWLIARCNLSLSSLFQTVWLPMLLSVSIVFSIPFSSVNSTKIGLALLCFLPLVLFRFLSLNDIRSLASLTVKKHD